MTGAFETTVWTPERLALLDADYPHCVDTAVLLAPFNSLAGPPVTLCAVMARACKRNVRKTREVMSAIASARAKRTDQVARLTASRPSSRTPARLALMLAEYATAVDPVAFLAALNALPGVPMSGARAVQNWAWLLRLRKTPETAAAIRLRYAATASVKARQSPERKAARIEAAAARAALMRQAAAIIKPARPEMQRGRIPPPVIREPDTAPVAVEQSPELADRAVERKHDMARWMLAKKIAADKVRATTGLPLHVVFRIAGELRSERAGP